MEKARYDAMNVAHYAINKCAKEGQPISNLQLQKILFFLQRDYLKKYDRPLFKDKIEAWAFGPVVPIVYYNYCGYGALKINKSYNEQIFDDDKEFVDHIIEERREYNPWTLVNETHKEGSAWKRIYGNGEGNKQEIPIEYIKEYA